MTDLDLARRAVACRGWRWLPGMRVYAESLGCDDNTIIPDGYTGNAAELAQLRPDFRDPATRGCLLQLVREAWDKQIYAVPICDVERTTRWLAVVPDPPIPAWGWRDFEGPTEEASLVAALEAAPTR